MEINFHIIVLMMKHINDLGSHKNKTNNDLVLFMQYQAVDHDSKNPHFTYQGEKERRS